MSKHETPPLPAKVQTLDVEGQTVKLVETEDGTRTWLCDCVNFKRRAAKFPDKGSFCGHTAVAIARCIDDGSIKVTF